MAAPAELIRRIRRIEITTRRAVQDTLAGGYHSVFKGRGMAFSEVRPYQPGDEIRSIDWNVTARMGEPFVKVFTEERELTALIAVDRSASQDAGFAPQAKAEVSAELAALLVFSALESGDRAGLLLFTDKIERYVPPRRGLWPVTDAETGETVLLDFSDAHTRTAYSLYARERAEKRDKIFRKLSLDAVRVRPGDDYVAPLAALFRVRARRRGA